MAKRFASSGNPVEARPALSTNGAEHSGADQVLLGNDQCAGFEKRQIWVLPKRRPPSANGDCRDALFARQVRRSRGFLWTPSQTKQFRVKSAANSVPHCSLIRHGGTERG